MLDFQLLPVWRSLLMPRAGLASMPYIGQAVITAVVVKPKWTLILAFMIYPRLSGAINRKPVSKPPGKASGSILEGKLSDG